MSRTTIPAGRTHAGSPPKSGAPRIELSIRRVTIEDGRGLRAAAVGEAVGHAVLERLAETRVLRGAGEAEHVLRETKRAIATALARSEGSPFDADD